MQQNLLTGTQGPELEQIEPSGGIYLGHHSGLDQAQAFWHRHGVASIEHHLFGHATAREQTADAIPHLPGAAGADFDNYPGALQAQRLARTGWRRIKPGALQQVSPVEPSGSHLDPNLPRVTGLRRLFQPLCTPFDALQCLHAASIVQVYRAQRRPPGFRLAPTEPGALKYGLICVINCHYVESA